MGFLLALLSSCNGKEEIIPMENPEIESFSVFYEGNDYTIFKRTEIEPRSYISLGYGFGEGDTGCLIGAFHMLNYRVMFELEYYNLQQAGMLELFTCEKMLELEIIGEIY